MSDHPPLKVKIWSEAACFTRPEMKVERVSYPCPTPSAARGILEAIFWKPEFEWRVREIWVLKPIRYLSLLRNEVDSRASVSSARSGGLFIAEDHRVQRHTLALRDVGYLIHADVSLKGHADSDPAKYRDQFRRRVNRGQCFHRPYLGCREFAAAFGPPDESERPVDHGEEIGRMLFDLDYERDEERRGVSGTPRFFQARIEGGILRVPQDLYSEGD